MDGPTPLKPDFTATYETEAPRIARYLAARCVLPDAVEDLVQAVFLGAWQHWETYEDRGYPVSAWLYAIAHSRLIDYRRRQCRAAEPLDETIGGSATYEDHVIARMDVRSFMERARLTSRQRQVLSLRYLSDLGNDEIAAALGLSVGVIKALLQRGRANLQQALESSANARTCRVCGDPLYACGLCLSHYWQAARRRQVPAAAFSPKT
jgi:RNA polymerase sigma-70 factor (ECF subfamily)